MLLVLCYVFRFVQLWMFVCSVYFMFLLSLILCFVTYLMQGSHPGHVDPVDVNVDAHLQELTSNPNSSSANLSLTLLSIVMIAWPSLSLMLSSKTTFTVSHSHDIRF